MYSVGDYIMYFKDVCKIVDIKENYINNTDYYLLEKVNDNSLKLSIPINNKAIRNLLTKDEVLEIINNILKIDVITYNEKTIENEYKRLLSTGKHEDLIKIIKTTYLRNKERLDNKKKISDKDKSFFDLAEKYLYTEFSIVLNMTFDETKNFIINKVMDGINNE